MSQRMRFVKSAVMKAKKTDGRCKPCIYQEQTPPNNHARQTFAVIAGDWVWKLENTLIMQMVFVASAENAANANRSAEVLPARKAVKMLPTDAVRKYARENKISIVKFDAMMEFARWFERPYYEATQQSLHLTAFGGWTGVAFLFGIIVGLLAAHFGGR